MENFYEEEYYGRVAPQRLLLLKTRSTVFKGGTLDVPRWSKDEGKSLKGKTKMVRSGLKNKSKHLRKDYWWVSEYWESMAIADNRVLMFMNNTPGWREFHHPHATVHTSLRQHGRDG